MADHPMKQVSSGGNLISSSEVKAMSSLLRTRKTKLFLYCLVSAFVAGTVFLAFNPSGTSLASSQLWFSNFFAAASHIFPDSYSRPPSQEPVLVVDPATRLGSRVDNRTVVGVPLKDPVGSSLSKAANVSSQSKGAVFMKNETAKVVDLKTHLDSKTDVAVPVVKKESKPNVTEKASLSTVKNGTTKTTKSVSGDGRRKRVPLKECNIFQGSWVKDDSYPLYQEGSCPHIDEPFDCFLNGRPDLNYQKLRWQPDDCDIPSKDYYQEGSHIYGELSVAEAFRRALTTWARWIDANINPKKTLVFFRGYSANHFRGGQWNSGGMCDKETEPIKDKNYLSSYPPKMSILENVMKGMKTHVSYLNITRMTDYRKDAHPSIYRKPNLTEEERIAPDRFQDCSHWCLPGVPDLWNELLYAQLIIKQQQAGKS
ncbi:hypothetical protein QJS04_geneDACA017498 [Acorus gramineus]|uniref:Trichome birefringence-like C-terminal domain-containing protein n=1 Tax=Acorus gramineus TaxID=55184 RepID=A0AAV9AHX3_ACOGR|nr:hypothetical protein QJS04_geneDACA017498 [Acorus gramineus]